MPLASRLLFLALLALLALGGCGGRVASPPAAPRAPPPRLAPPPPDADPLDRPLLLDARVTKGKLENGLTYYVLPHPKPEKRAELWLVLNAGSIVEDDDQRGLAHFVEHMAFDGTRRFPKRALTDLLERSGARPGADFNAATSFDDTTYRLHIPTDQPGLMDQAITVLRDWADGVTFDQVDVERERAIVLEERRLGLGAGTRLFDKQAPVIFAGSKYAERLPIGQLETVKSASRDALLRFYRDWYRPDLMSVIAVGDFDASDMEAKIKREMSSLAGPASPRPRVVPALPRHADTLVSVETDPELPRASVAVMRELPPREERTERDFRRRVAERLYAGMLASRLDAVRLQHDEPFWDTSGSVSMMVRAADGYYQSATVKPDGVERGLSALLSELARVERHGFIAPELERAKSSLLLRYEQLARQRASRDASTLAAEISRNFLLDEPMTGIETEVEMVKRFLPSCSLEEIRGVGKVLAGGSRVITIAGPASMTKPTTKAITALARKADARESEPYLETASGGPLMAEPPPHPGRVIERTTIPEIGVIQWTLSNGVRVVVKPTTFAESTIGMTAFAPGGTSLASDADFPSAAFAATLVGDIGAGRFGSVELKRMLSGKLVSVDVRIGQLESGIRGRSSAEDLETMLQLVYLKLTQPYDYRYGFPEWLALEVAAAQSRRLSPEGAFDDELQLASTMNRPRERPWTPEVLKTIDLDKAKAFYNARFADAANLTFVFVGSIDVPRLEWLANTYLGSLPWTGRKETWRDTATSWPPGIVTKTLVMGHEERALFTLTFHGNEKWSVEKENDQDLLVDVVRLRLRTVLREDLGGVYGVSVSGHLWRRPHPESTVNVRFGCAPDNVEKLKKAVFEEIASLQKNGVTEEVLAKVKEQRRRAREIDAKDNRYWLWALDRAYTFGDDPRLIADASGVVARETSDHVREAAKLFLTPKQYLLGLLMPVR